MTITKIIKGLHQGEWIGTLQINNHKFQVQAYTRNGAIEKGLRYYQSLTN